MSVCLYLIGGRNKVLCEFYLKIWTMCRYYSQSAKTCQVEN